MHRVFKELLLVFVLIFNVQVDLAILLLLILDEAKQTCVDGDLQLLVIVSILDDLVNSIFEVVDGCVMFSNFVPIHIDVFLNYLLTSSQIFNHETQTGID